MTGLFGTHAPETLIEAEAQKPLLYWFKVGFLFGIAFGLIAW